MVPRKKLDIGWSDLAFALLESCLPASLHAAERLEALWSPDALALATSSVRSGLDLVLQQLALPAGSEVLVSAVTIRDMVAIIERHGLRPVPVDLQPSTCAPGVDALEAVVTPNTRALLIAHLFGARLPMDRVVATAKRYNLFVFEDCAQAFAADGYRGNPLSDATMFSFGPIKTATALGGGILLFRDAVRCADARRRQAAYPVQGRVWYARRVIKYAVIKALTNRFPYTVFTQLCGWLGISHDRAISASVRGFAEGDLLPQLRHRPAPALLALMQRRLRRYHAHDLSRRMEASAKVARALPAGSVPGIQVEPHCHWLLPFQSGDADGLVACLLQHGFDATRGATSLHAVAGAMGNEAPAAARMMARMVYLPTETATDAELERLIGVVIGFEWRLGAPAGTEAAPWTSRKP